VCQIIKGRKTSLVTSDEDAKQIAIAYVKKYMKEVTLERYQICGGTYYPEIECWIFLFKDTLYPYPIDGANHFGIHVFKSGEVRFSGGR